MSEEEKSNTGNGQVSHALELTRLKEALAISNTQLRLQQDAGEKRADELVRANATLIFQNTEKEKRAAELVIANAELAYQNEEKEKRAVALIIANEELIFQNEEKMNRAAELVLANVELIYQNKEKVKRAAELVIANQELAYQNAEKEKKAAELVLANAELVYQNEEKEKRAAELIAANKELEAFTFVSSHDLQEPLRKIQTFSDRILTEEFATLSEKGKKYFDRIRHAALHMKTLINDLLSYSRADTSERQFEDSDLNVVVAEVLDVLEGEIFQKAAIIEVSVLCNAPIIAFQFRQLLQNLIGNALKFAKLGDVPHITIESKHTLVQQEVGANSLHAGEYCQLTVTDNGIGFEPQYQERIFEMFQRVHGEKKYEGNGMGLTIVKKIVDNHHGFITATGELDKGARFDIFIPRQPPHAGNLITRFTR